jgi:hypothetical protein
VRHPLVQEIIDAYSQRPWNFLKKITQLLLDEAGES